MTNSVYIIGGAGTGKSTFTQQILDEVNALGPLEDLYQKPNSRGTVITLRGHRSGSNGMYLGCMRDSFPGTDGLDRVSYIPGEAWLEKTDLPDWILGEGATLAVRRFLKVLHETTDFLLIHLRADEFVKELRFQQRGSTQDEKFVLSTETKSLNLYNDMMKAGVQCADIDTADPDAWAWAKHTCLTHLGY